MGVFLPKVQSEDGIESLVRRLRDWSSGRHNELFEAAMFVAVEKVQLMKNNLAALQKSIY